MADAAVSFLLENLQQLVLYHAHLLSDAQNQVERLGHDLGRFKAFLQDSSKLGKKDARTKEMVKQIIDVVYDAEDTIDDFVAKASNPKLMKKLLGTATKISIAKQVEEVLNKMKDIHEKYKTELAALASEPQSGPANDERKTTPERIVNVVGLEDEAETIIGYLMEEKGELDIISIIGMPGLGKTTLAGKIFRDSTLQFEFPIRIWVYVSQEYNKQEILLSILREFKTITPDMYQLKAEDLAKSVREFLKKAGRYLIVMDDVWTKEAWNDLKDALPEENKRGKILITSRHEDVAKHANLRRNPHNLRFLRLDESKTLLTLKVFGTKECPTGFDEHVTTVAKQCAGLPLAIVVIGGILSKKVDNTPWWKKVSENVKTYLSEDQERGMGKIIELSFNKLPYHLRACFLYLGTFPEDSEIQVRKLIQLWVAEGFIRQMQNIALEETAEEYLDDLIHRNLVMVGKITPYGRLKTCRLHDMMREFCISEAGREEENFYQEIKQSREGILQTTGSQIPGLHIEKSRRLCIHSQVFDFLERKNSGPRVRSFLCFAKEETKLDPRYNSCIPTAFRLLRILDTLPLRFTRFPADLPSLVHLRYIALSSTFKILPDAISKLWNLQTLIVYTSERALEIKADIWTMVQLRHVKTNASATLPKSKKGKHGERLQTLSAISPQSCTEEVLSTARNLKKLGICGMLSLLLDIKNGTSLFDSVGKLLNLEKLKLVNDASGDILSGLPPALKFPPKLRFLTLANTRLDWKHMSTLAMLEHLEVLKLKDHAFVGEAWEPFDGGFRKLEVLYIGRTDLAYWSAKSNHFPMINCIMLRNCEQLLEVPLSLADVPNFKILDLYRTSKSLATSAKRIQKQKGGLKLTIYPPDHDQP